MKCVLYVFVAAMFLTACISGCVKSGDENDTGANLDNIEIEEIRTVLPEDADQLFAKGHWIAAHLNKEPVWEPVPQQHLDAILPEYAKLANDGLFILKFLLLSPCLNYTL